MKCVHNVAVDFESNLLFWVDAKLHHIACSDLLGNNQRIILTSYQHLRHPFAITVFEVSTDLVSGLGNHRGTVVGGVAQWLGRQSFAGGLSLIYG